CLQTDNMPLTF
nr:immunoglobulin light chain junction region [Mus musculus]NSL98150.1 immunoglobulin light chain junction region [Mus musculus]NSM00292.1 immunoglobulin light chain junction region [Mus musculus]NSM00728.1 immunoglobulin light chain junction region [Mus musculus]NSM02124.1 immunoglobulin light chain junction region [Mus musculus]